MSLDLTYSATAITGGLSLRVAVSDMHWKVQRLSLISPRSARAAVGELVSFLLQIVEMLKDNKDPSVRLNGCRAEYKPLVKEEC